MEVPKENDALKRMHQELADLQRALAQTEEREKQERDRQEALANQQAANTISKKAEKVSEWAAEQATNQNESITQEKELDEDTRKLLQQWQEYRERERGKSRRPEDRDERDWELER